MSKKYISTNHFKLGRISAILVFYLLLFYAIVTLLGLLSLKSPLDPIGDPYFTMMEILILVIAPLMLIVMVEINNYADNEVKIFSRLALIFMIIMTVITSSIHFVVLTLNQQVGISNLPWFHHFFSFKWPSVVYSLDILAWDWFFAFSFLFASQVFRESGLEKSVRFLMIISGILSLLGLLGIPFNNMQIRNIGIIGYALVSPVAFLLLSKIFRMNKSVNNS